MFWLKIATTAFIYLAIISYFRIKSNRGRIEFIYPWGFILGAFVWEDLLVFSVYFALASTITVLFNDLRIGALLLASFWLVRSAGETLYFFLQQFIEPKHSPHFIDDKFDLFTKIFGMIKPQQVFIIMQVFFQSILILSLSTLVYLIINWQQLAPIQ